MTTFLLFKSSNYDINRTNYDLLNYTDIFDNIILYNEQNLDNIISNIINNIINKYGNRGYGYWIWKPYLILQELNKLNDGDILFFSNIHSDFKKCKDKFKEVFTTLNNLKYPILLGNSGCKELNWTSKPLINYIENKLNYKFTDNELNYNQYGAGNIFILKNNFTYNFIKQWFDLMNNGIEYISDIYNNDIINDNSFIENRHDQSVLSLLYKYYHLIEDNNVNIINNAENNI